MVVVVKVRDKGWRRTEQICNRPTPTYQEQQLRRCFTGPACTEHEGKQPKIDNTALPESLLLALRELPESPGAEGVQLGGAARRQDRQAQGALVDLGGQPAAGRSAGGEAISTPSGAFQEKTRQT